MRILQFLSLIYLFVLVACQTMGPNAGVECVAGFVKTKNGVCRSLKNMSTEEVFEADAHFNNQAPVSEEEIATRRETQRMMDSMRAAEAASRHQQMMQQTQYQQQQATNRADRSQAPVKFLDEETSPAARQNGSFDRAAFRSELKGSFTNETRSTLGNGGRR